LDRAMQPGSIDRLKKLGIVIEQQIPTGAGAEIHRAGLLGLMVQKGMVPYKWADSVNRAIVYNGMEARIDSALTEFSKGKKSAEWFMRKSGATLFGLEEYNNLKNLFNASDIKGSYAGFKHRLATIAVDRTQFLYSSFDQPKMFRSGVGRLFGQYTSWPLNFVSLVGDRMSSNSLTAAQKSMFLARLGTNTGAIALGLHSAGINPQSFAPWNMAMFGPGPYFQLLTDALEAANGNQQSFNRVTSVCHPLYRLHMKAKAYSGPSKHTKTETSTRPSCISLPLLSAPMCTPEEKS
jgi:hypothetical protein